MFAASGGTGTLRARNDFFFSFLKNGGERVLCRRKRGDSSHPGVVCSTLGEEQLFHNNAGAFAKLQCVA